MPLGAVITPPESAQEEQELSEVTVILAGAPVKMGQDDSSSLARKPSPPPPLYTVSCIPAKAIGIVLASWPARYTSPLPSTATP